MGNPKSLFRIFSKEAGYDIVRQRAKVWQREKALCEWHNPGRV
jgi:hypothetical protein